MGTKQILVVGAGFAGATIAHQLASQGFSVHVIDSRDHIGGNAYDFVNEYGITIHKYGAHIFHTSNKTVFDYLSNFTEWIPYQHKVVAKDKENFVIFPPQKSYVDSVGLEYVFNTFYKPYTKKMWALTTDEIDESVLKRVPVRNDDSDLYFPDAVYQYLPKYGYTNLIKNMLDHTNIQYQTSIKFDKTMENNYDHVFNSMPIDVYYDFIYGHLPYRSIKFHTTVKNCERLSTHPIINFTDDGIYTRMIEWKNFPNHGYNSSHTSITYEEPCDYIDNYMERYYPVKDAKGINREIYKKYKEIPNDKVTFIGRCGMYVYIDMDQAVASSLATAQKYMNSLTSI